MKINQILLMFLIFFITKNIYAINYSIEVIGNTYIDKQIVISLIDELPENIDDIDENRLIKELNETGYFENIEISSTNNVLNIKLKEYPLFKEIFFRKNKRFKKEDLLKIFQSNNEYNVYNKVNIDKTVDQLNSLYKSFGYNSVDIQYETKKNEENEIDLIFTIIEGKISKIRTINFNGNNSFNKNQLLNQIKSRERNYLNFIFNSNFKINIINEDIVRLLNYYQNNGFRNVKIKTKFEFYSSNNYFDVFFNIDEGVKFLLDEIDLNIQQGLFNDVQLEKLNSILESHKSKKVKSENLTYDDKFLENIKKDLAQYIFNEGLYFFEITILEKADKDKISVLFDINTVEPIYIKEININGNTRTKDNVIRRELLFAEGDAYNDILLQKSIKKIRGTGMFSYVNIEDINDGKIEVKIKEKPTGSFQFGLGFNSYSGATFVTSLKENNFQGTGRKVNFTFNNSSNRSEYKVGLVDPYAFNKDLDLFYSISYKQSDLSDTSSYKYDDLSTDVGIMYLISENFSHKISLGYTLKDYEITDESNVSASISNLSGANALFLLKNNLTLNRLDSYMKPTKGDYANFENVFSPITNSTDGYTKNTLLFRKYYSGSYNIYSFQSLLGNIFSLQNENIDNSDKFSLGGRWLRGFDNYGAGPRDSASSYIGGNNLIVTKLDFLRPLDKFSDNPIYINLFADAGKVWSNKTSPTYNNESIRSSYGFGFNYYSPIGPIGFSWGFPLQDESEDIKRMFTFVIGNVN